MSKKLNWLDSFAEEQAKRIEKTASINKKAKQVIVDCEDVPNAVEGAEVTYKNEKYTVVDASYTDQLGNGVVLEACKGNDEDDAKKKTAGVEDLNEEETPVEEEIPAEEAPVTPEMPMGGAPAGGDGKTPVSTPMQGGTKKLTDAPERAVQPYQGQEAYNNGDVRDQVEPQKFNQEAEETVRQISEENAKDRTRPEGRYSPNRIIDRMVTDTIGPAPEIGAPVEETPVEEAPVEEEDFDKDLDGIDFEGEDSAEETPVEEEETPAEEEVPAEEPVEEVPAEESVEETPAEEVPAEEEKEEEDPKKDAFASNRILRKMISRK